MRTDDSRRLVTTKARATGIPAAHIVVAVVIPLIIYFGYSAGQKALEVYRLNQEASQVKAETEALKVENDQLRKRIDFLSSDAYVEKVAREELNLVKPGDKAVVVLSPAEQKENATSALAQVVVDETPNWLKWWGFFFAMRR